MTDLKTLRQTLRDLAATLPCKDFPTAGNYIRLVSPENILALLTALETAEAALERGRMFAQLLGDHDKRVVEQAKGELVMWEHDAFLVLSKLRGGR